MKEITDRIGVHKVGLTFLQEFNWIEREQPISDYGIDMHIEIVNNEILTGQLIGLQIKSGESYFKETTKDEIVYRGKKKHLNYWQFHSIPVLILLYNPNKDKIYWEKILSKNTIDTGEGWKINIPKKNILTANSRGEIEKYYYNRNHFVTIELSDSSTGLARRISAKILVDKNAISKSSMERMIPYLVEDFKKSDYHRNAITKSRNANLLADIVFLYFYIDIQQAKRGFPFCRAFWNSESCEAKVELSNPDVEKDGLQIKWGRNYEMLSETMNENQMTKGEYIEIANRSYQVSTEIYQKIRLLNSNPQTDINSLINEIIKFEERINEIDEAINFKRNYTPLECIDLDKLLSSSIIHLSNILLVVKDEKRNETNKRIMIKTSLKDCEEGLKYYEYELKKIK